MTTSQSAAEICAVELPQISSNERRSLARVPFQLKFRLRDDCGKRTFAATSHDVHPCGIQLETDAPVTPQMGVELWPEDNILEAYYVHGEVCWVRPLKGNGRVRCGINFKRRVEWNVPLSLFSRTFSAAGLSGGMAFADCILDNLVDGVFSVDSNWRITFFNRAAERLTGWRREDAVGRICREVFKANCCGKDCVLSESVNAGSPVENRAIMITRANGSRIGATISAMPLFDNSGMVAGGIQIFRGVKSALEQAAILDALGDGVLTVDSDWRITSFNRAAERITGLPRSEAVGRFCRDVMQASICGETCGVARSISTGKTETSHAAFLRNVDRARVPVSLCSTPLYDNDGKLTGGVESFRDLRRERAQGKEHWPLEIPLELKSEHDALKKIFALLPQVGRSGSNVLLQGEAGTGRELIARSLHELSDQRQGPFVVVHCGSLPDALLEAELFGAPAGSREEGRTEGIAWADGQDACWHELQTEIFGGPAGAGMDPACGTARQGGFAAAAGGTLFLAEVDELSPAMQVRLLQALAARNHEPPPGSQVRIGADVRIVAAAAGSLEKDVAAGRFRRDLYYRLNVVNLALPPLRERPADIPALADSFVDRLNREKGRDVQGISAAALRMLLAHDYPGNVQELQNILEYAFIFCPGGMIRQEHLAGPLVRRREEPGARSGGDKDQDEPLSLMELEKTAISSALLRNGWKRMATCRQLGISKDTLRRKIDHYGITQPQEAPLAD